ncbi:glutamate--tRNA ligase [Rickettsiales bacterium LUAb2]
MTIITRFAPSPTGFLHIGGARTALFNYLYSKHNNGKFLLRIEDTDQKRSTKEAVDAIINGLTWLNIIWDQQPVMQTSNVNRHKQVALELLNNNKAYYCYCPPKKELDPSDKNLNQKCNCLNLSKKPNDNVAPSIRILVNKEGSSLVNDLVMGSIEVKNTEIDDFIILRSDQTPTYLLAVVVDDIDMQVTHVIRGDDHLTNTFRQIQIYKNLGLPVPNYAHIPLIYGEDGSKMSKRHGALGAHEYQELGYLPEAICNYLLKLGWSHGDDEIITIGQAIAWFDIKDVNKSPARFDFNKLNSINAHYIKQLTTNDLYTKILPFITKELSNKQKLPNYEANLKLLLPFLQNRFKTLVEIAKESIFIITNDLAYSEEIITLLSKQKLTLEAQLDILDKLDDFTRDNLHDAIKNYAENNNLGLGKAVEGLRLALAFNKTSPASVFDIMAILGKEISLNRIKNAIYQTK